MFGKERHRAGADNPNPASWRAEKRRRALEKNENKHPGGQSTRCDRTNRGIEVVTSNAKGRTVCATIVITPLVFAQDYFTALVIPKPAECSPSFNFQSRILGFDNPRNPSKFIVCLPE